MPTVDLFGDWITIPADYYDDWEYPVGDVDGALEQSQLALDRAIAWHRGDSPGSVSQVREVTYQLWGACIHLRRLAQWALVWPDAYTIADDLQLDFPDLTVLYDTIAGLEARIALLEGRPLPTIPTLDSLTAEAHDRQVEITETWLDLISKMLLLET